jgi:hypothetical protein
VLLGLLGLSKREYANKYELGPTHQTMACVLTMAAHSPQPITLKIVEKYGGSLKSWRIKQATFQCDPERIDRHKPRQVHGEIEGRQKSDDGTQWSIYVSLTRLLATVSRSNSGGLRENVKAGIGLVVVFSDMFLLGRLHRFEQLDNQSHEEHRRLQQHFCVCQYRRHRLNIDIFRKTML